MTNRIKKTKPLSDQAASNKNEAFLNGHEKFSVKPTAKKNITKTDKPKKLAASTKILLQSPYAVAFFLGENMIIELANDAIKEVWSKGPDVEGRSIFEVMPELNNQTFPGLLREVYESGKAYHGNEALFKVMRNGVLTNSYFNFVYQPYFDEDDSIIGVVCIANDVTETVLAKQKLEDNNNQIQDVLRNAPAAIALLEGPDHIYLLANDFYQRVFNRSETELIGKTLREAFPEIGGQGVYEILEAVFKSGEPYIASEFPVSWNKEGKGMTQGYFNFVVQPIKNAAGEVKSIMINCVEVTEQIDSRKKIKESEAKLQSLIAAAPIAIGLFIGRDLVIETPNQEFIDIVGKGPGIVGKRLTDAMPELIEYGQPYLKILDDVFTSGKMYKSLGDPVNIIRNGVMHHGFFNIYYVPLFDGEGKVYGIMDIATDVTEQVINRKKIEDSEVQYRQLADSLPNLVWQTDAMGIQTFASKRWKEFTGIDPENEDSFEKVVHPEDLKSIRKAWAHSLSIGTTYYHEVRLKSKSGQYHWFQVNAEPLYNDKKEIEKWVGTYTDITERKEAEEIIKESEQRFRNLADQSPMFVYIVEPNAEATMSYFNKTWLDYTGQDFEEAIGRAWDGIVHPDDVKQVLDIYVPAFQKRKSYTLPEIRLKRHDGEYRWHTFKSNPRYMEDGTFIGYVGVGFDIHERKIAEDALKESEQKLSTLADNMQNLAWIADGDGWIYWYNQRWFDFTGTTLEDMLGWGWQKVHHPDHVNRILEFSKKAWQINEPFELTFPLRRHDGEYRWFLTRARPIADSEGKVIRWFGTNTDITEQKETLALLEYRKALLEAHNEASVDGILLVDAKGKILSYNKRFIEIWNMPQQIVDAKDDEAALAYAMTQLVNPAQFIEKVNYLYEHPTESSTDILEFKDSKMVERHGYPVIADDGSYYAWSWTFRDITEVKKADFKIRESEKQLRKTTEHFQIATTAAAVGTWSLDLASETLIWSGLHKKMWGYDENRTDLLYEDWHKVILPGDKETAFAEVAKALKTKTMYEASYRIKRADNEEERWIRSIGQYFYNDAGEAITLTGVSIDITDQKKAEIALKESEHRYHNLIFSSPSAIGVLKGPDLIITTANDAIMEIWGKGMDVFGKPYFDLVPELAEQGYKEVFEEVYKTGNSYNAIETPVSILQKGKMQLKYYNFILYPQRNIDGKVESIGIIATEVTRQAEVNKKIKESEEHFRQLAELMPDMVSTADAAGNITYYSRNWEKYTGISREKLLNEGWARLMHPEDLEPISDSWQHSVQTGKDFEMEFRMRNYAGEYKWHLSRASAVKDETGKILKWIGSMTEIQTQKEAREKLERAVRERTVELRQANESLEEKNEELIKLNKELESFAYISSHDLQEPLRKIQTFADRIIEQEEEALSDKGKDYFKRMLNAAQRMQLLIEDLLSYSRTSMGEKKFETADLNKIMEEVEDNLEETIKETNATIESSNLGEINVIPFQFRQMMYNLIGNSLKFLKPGNAPHIIIKSEIAKGEQFQHKDLIPEKKYCHIMVSDNGIGFDPQYKERIFGVFQRLHGKAEYNGTGIGLAIVKKIVENHEGFIIATGESGKGARFDIYFPA